MAGHSHTHGNISSKTLNRSFTVGIVVNLVYVVIELAAGIHYNSLALISDAGHNLSDVATLALAMLAFRLSRAKATGRFTYGFRKSTILASLINSIILFVAIGGILWESIGRMLHPLPLNGQAISIVAAMGIVVNGATALLFFRDKEHDLNVKGAYLHLLADAAVSAGVVIAGVVIQLTGLFWFDLAISLVIVGVIFYSTWHLFRESLYLTMDAVPRGIDLAQITGIIGQVPGVQSVHHVHIWALSTTQNALTAQIEVDAAAELDEQNRIRQQVQELLHRNSIHHTTLELTSCLEPTRTCKE